MRVMLLAGLLTIVLFGRKNKIQFYNYHPHSSFGMKKLKVLMLLLICGIFSSCNPNFWLEVLATTLVDMTSTSTSSYNTSSVYTPTYTGSTTNTSTSSSQSYQKTAHPRKCTNCAHIGNGKCKLCRGTGKWYNTASSAYQTCPHCNGTGKCQVCNGTGTTGYDYY